MNKIIPFDYHGNKVRSLLIDGEPWFVAKDVCEILEINNNRDAISRLDDDEKGVASTDTLGGSQEMSIVSESGLYSLTLGSKKPEAKPFKHWVTHEVIPSIRKHGAYMTPDAIEKVLSDPDTIIRLATDLKTEREQRKVLETKTEADKPKVLFAEAVSISESSILIGQLAKMLKQNGIDIGQNRLFEWMRQNGYLIRQKGNNYNLPTQKAMDMGLFRIKESTHLNGDGVSVTTKTTKVTGKGQQYFINKFLAKKSA